MNESYPQPASLEIDVALFPNAFQGINPSTFLDVNETFLRLVDGGEDGESIPFQPLLVKARNIDVIIAVDATGDNGNFTAGGSLIVSAAHEVRLSQSELFVGDQKPDVSVPRSV